MLQLQKQTSINRVALALANTGHRAEAVDRVALQKALEPLKQVLLDAYRRGGKLGAQHVSEMMNRG